MSFSPSPRGLLLEPTSRCNLACGMCPRTAPGCAVEEADLSPEALEALVPDLPAMDRVSMAGLGEPLLHPRLPDIIALLRRHLPGHAQVGIQTNALLLTDELALALVRAGLGECCVSVDVLDAASAQGATARRLHGGASLPAIEAAFARLRRLGGRQAPGGVSLGVECVLTRENAASLPDLLRWAAGQGASFVIVSHLLPAAAAWAEASLAHPAAAAARRVFQAHREAALAEGLDFRRYPASRFRFVKSEEDLRLTARIQAMQAEALAQGVWLNLRDLLAQEEDAVAQALPEIFENTRALARERGLSLHLPALAGADRRSCPFLERELACVDAQGRVAPCHFLWRRHVCVQQGRSKRITPRFLGRLPEASLSSIWADPATQAFQREALADEHPRCHDCNAGPCGELAQAREDVPHSCLGSTVPCGHCPWPLDLLACLGSERRQDAIVLA